MKFPIIEIVDRYAIAMVKYKETNGQNAAELTFYEEQMKSVNINTRFHLVTELVEHHATVWSLEDDFKKARIDNIALDEIGRRAIQIRDYSYERSRLKNALAELYGDKVREVKQY